MNKKIPVCHPDRKYGAFGLCNRCYYKKYCLEHLEFVEKNRIRSNERHKKQMQDPAIHQKYRENYKKKKFGVTPENYTRMLKEQGGVCAICRTNDPGHSNIQFTYFTIDHDHVTGKVRGLLCRDCNVFLGGYEKRRHLLNIIEIYLSKFISEKVAA